MPEGPTGPLGGPRPLISAQLVYWVNFDISGSVGEYGSMNVREREETMERHIRESLNNPDDSGANELVKSLTDMDIGETERDRPDVKIREMETAVFLGDYEVEERLLDGVREAVQNFASEYNMGIVNAGMRVE